MNYIFLIQDKNSYTESNREKWILLQIGHHFMEYNDIIEKWQKKLDIVF